MEPRTPPLVIVAAVARNRVIGGGNSLPWKLKSDLARFRAMTWGKPLIMGRKTFESIGRALPGRETIVVTRTAENLPAGVYSAGDPDSAVALGRERAALMGASEVIVAGGGEIYRALMDHCSMMHITEVDLAPEGDTLFPEIDPSAWTAVSRDVNEAGPGDAAACTFVDYVRTQMLPGR